MFHRDQRDLLCCSGPISSDEQTRNHDDLLLRRFESGGKLGFFRCHHEHNRRKPGLEGLCGFCFFALAVVGQPTSEALFVPATPSFPRSPSITVSASVTLSASMLRGICDGGIGGGTSTVSVSLPFSSLASRHRCSTHRKTSVRLRRALPTGSHSCAQPSTFSERCDAASP